MFDALPRKTAVFEIFIRKSLRLGLEGPPPNLFVF